MTIQYDRDINSDFQNLGNTLITLFNSTVTDGREHMIFVFDDGTAMEVIGSSGAVTHAEVKSKYESSGLVQVYGEDVSTFGRINYARVQYSAHTHPLVTKENEQGRPSGMDVSEGNGADYEVVRTLMGGRPHYVVSPSHIYCIDYSRDSRTIVSYRTDIKIPVTEVVMQVSFAGKWNWLKLPDSSITYLYVSDDHYVPEELNPSFIPPTLTIESTEPFLDGNNLESGIIIDESGTTIETNQTFEE